MAITKAQEERRKENPSSEQGIVFPDETIENKVFLQFTRKEQLYRNQFKILTPDPESKKPDRKATCVGFFNTKIARQAKDFLKKTIEDYKKLGWKLKISYDRIIIKEDSITDEEKTVIIKTLEQMTIFENPTY